MGKYFFPEVDDITADNKHLLTSSGPICIYLQMLFQNVMFSLIYMVLQPRLFHSSKFTHLLNVTVDFFFL
jgi:hypothetical protein